MAKLTEDATTRNTNEIGSPAPAQARPDCTDYDNPTSSTVTDQ
jgi:hypothetical protein